jgi:hypothetical protein
MIASACKPLQKYVYPAAEQRTESSIPLGEAGFEAAGEGGARRSVARLSHSTLFAGVSRLAARALLRLSRGPDTNGRASLDNATEPA